VGRRPTPSSEWFLKGPHLISPFTQWAACSPHLLLNDSYNTYTKVKVVSLCEVWLLIHLYKHWAVACRHRQQQSAQARWRRHRRAPQDSSGIGYDNILYCLFDVFNSLLFYLSIYVLMYLMYWMFCFCTHLFCIWIIIVLFMQFMFYFNVSITVDGRLWYIFCDYWKRIPIKGQKYEWRYVCVFWL